MSRPKFRIRRDDTVIVTAGKDKGTVGRVLKVLSDDFKVVVEGVRRVKRHQKPTGDQPGAIIEKEMPIHMSNVSLYDADAKRRVKVGYGLVEGKKVRVDRKTGAAIDN